PVSSTERSRRFRQRQRAAAQQAPLAMFARAVVAEARARFTPELRAATAPAMTTVAGWAQELGQVTNVFLASLTGASAAADLLGRGLRVQFNGNRTISLPLIAVGSASFIGEGKPIPVVQFQIIPNVKLEPHKLALIS